MTVYRRKNSPHYHYDFQLRGRRFYGSTKCTTLEEAEAFEATERVTAKKKIVSEMRRSLARLQPPKRVVEPWKPQVGVYLLILDGVIGYIGSSLSMPERVATHRSNGRVFDEVFYIETTEGQRTQLEATLIRAINPPQNKVHRTGTNGHAPDHDTGHADQ